MEKSKLNKPDSHMCDSDDIEEIMHRQEISGSGIFGGEDSIDWANMNMDGLHHQQTSVKRKKDGVGN